MAKNNTFQKIIFLWMPVGFWALVIFLFSSRPATPVSEIHLTDFIIKKSAHVIEYAILATLLYRVFISSGVGKRKAGIYSVILAVLYGISDEYHQSFVPGRDPKLRDVFFDTIGAVGAIYIIWNILPKTQSKLKKLAKKLQIL